MTRKVMIGSPSYDGRIDVWYTNSLVNTIKESFNRDIEIIPIWVSFDALIQRARNDTIKIAMDMGTGIDGKTALQELTSAKDLGAPEYVVSESGPDHDKSFTAVVKVKGEEISSGEGKSKRDAEQAAARIAFEKLSKLDA